MQILGVFKTTIKSILVSFIVCYFLLVLPLFDGTSEYLTSGLESKDKNELFFLSAFYSGVQHSVCYKLLLCKYLAT